MNIYEKLKQSNKSVVIFGAGSTGKFIFELCRKNGVLISAFVDNADTMHGMDIDGCQIYALKDVEKVCDKECVFIISVQDIIQTVWQIQQLGNYEWIPVYHFYTLSEIEDKPFREHQKLEAVWHYHRNYVIEEPLFLNTLDLVVTERCSLRCKECSNLMQYYSKPKDFSVIELKSMLDRVASIYDEIYELRLLGGEPFMNKALEEILDYIIDIDNIKRVCVYTNGTILPSEGFLQIASRKKKTWFSISDYGELSSNLRNLVEKLEAYGIGYIVKPVEWWTRCSSFSRHRRKHEEQIRVYHECCAKSLVSLLDGILYPCPYIANALNIHALPYESGNAVEIMKENDISKLRERVRKVLKKREYFSLCDFCNGRPYANLSEEERIPPHEQVPMPLEYRKYKAINAHKNGAM